VDTRQSHRVQLFYVIGAFTQLYGCPVPSLLRQPVKNVVHASLSIVVKVVKASKLPGRVDDADSSGVLRHPCSSNEGSAASRRNHRFLHLARTRTTKLLVKELVLRLQARQLDSFLSCPYTLQGPKLVDTDKFRCLTA